MRTLIPCALVLVISELCFAIKVPVQWSDSDSEDNLNKNSETLQPIPNEYFTYTAKKPQFAIDVAQFHGVPNPEQHYKAYPIRPYTGINKPELGKHKIYDENKDIFQPFQQYTKHSEALQIPYTPKPVNYEVFHPYKAEEPGLQQIYKDPVLDKIRNDIRDSQHRLQEYEKEAGKPDIAPDEYLESIDETDRKKLPQKNVPATYEVHKPQRRPFYYQPVPMYSNREHILNQRFKHPWNQYDAKIRPVHYRPLKTHLGRLRQNHAIKYDDEHNLYPQLPPPQAYAEPVEGYDIYEKGKENYARLRNNFDDTFSGPSYNDKPQKFEKLEFQNSKQSDEDDDDTEDEFIPIKNYAQVRKTETYKHLPRNAAFTDAENLDEIRNAPRLREAIKSTKAQTVYTEEGYEDAGYDHAGEQKHASENEGHAGYLKEKEISGGKYKTPSVSAKYEDGSGSVHGDQVLHKEKWKNHDTDNDEEKEAEDYSTDDGEGSIEADIYEDVNGDRNKRENESNQTEVPDESNDDESNSKQIEESSEQESSSEHEVNKRETKGDEADKKFKVPVIDLSSTFLDIDKLANKTTIKSQPLKEKEKLVDKYPYYFKNLKSVHRDSPLRYSENLKFIPKKTKGGTEFYDSTTGYECPEVEEEVDPIPEKLKKEGHPNGSAEDPPADFKGMKNNHRLKGLGDKIDCFKAKFFGENPLDSPFFKEEIIANPDPISVPSSPVFKLDFQKPSASESKFNIFNGTNKLKQATYNDTMSLLDKLANGEKELQQSLIKTNNELRAKLISHAIPSINNANESIAAPSSFNADILQNVRFMLQNPFIRTPTHEHIQPNNYSNNPSTTTNTNHTSTTNDTTKTSESPLSRKRRAVSFMYEPYKIIRDSQMQDSRKTATSSNVSPLIRQLQSSKVLDRVQFIHHDSIQPVKRNVPSRVYKDIGKNDRQLSKNSAEETSFVDVSSDKRRGEPRYEIRHVNHKPQYTPVENKSSITMEDYQELKNNRTDEKNTQTRNINRNRGGMRFARYQSSTTTSTTKRPYFDVSQYIPRLSEMQKSASNTVQQVIKTTTQAPRKDNEKSKERSGSEESSENDDDDEEYEEYSDEEETVTSTSTTTSTTTSPKPAFKRRRSTTTTTTTTTQRTQTEEETEKSKLRLTTRFRNVPYERLKDDSEKKASTTSPKLNQNVEEEHQSEDNAPKYREKKKKSSKSTLVTDTKSYGEDGDKEDDMRKEEVDALIGVKQNMDEYTPLYEKENQQRSKEDETSDSSEDSEEEYEDSEEESSYEDEDEDDDESREEEVSEAPASTTTEIPKRSVVRTTEQPVTTTETRSSKIQLLPVVTKKKIEIHKEIPINNSSPHVTQFRQDIKEVEIIKEMPNKPVRRRPQKNIEALELYKDDKLAKEVNKLGSVEIFKQNLDLRTGPKHGGNYRSAKIIEQITTTTTTTKPIFRERKIKRRKEDAEASESENSKLIEFDRMLPSLRIRGRGFDESPLSRRENTHIELTDPSEQTLKPMHGGNYKILNNMGPAQVTKNAKIIELDENDDDNNSRRMHGGNFKVNDYESGEQSNEDYRSAKLVHIANPETKKQGDKNGRHKAAALLNSFAKAAPILTTTPAFILDPSKRKYYYVDD